MSICDKYIPGYYSPGMEAIQLDGDILLGLLKRVSPGAHRHLARQGVEPILFMTEWFLCAFARSLPWPTVLRVWDMFMCEGVKVRTALSYTRSMVNKGHHGNFDIVPHADMQTNGETSKSQIFYNLPISACPSKSSN